MFLFPLIELWAFEPIICTKSNYCCKLSHNTIVFCHITTIYFRFPIMLTLKQLCSSCNNVESENTCTCKISRSFISINLSRNSAKQKIVKQWSHSTALNKTNKRKEKTIIHFSQKLLIPFKICRHVVCTQHNIGKAYNR